MKETVTDRNISDALLTRFKRTVAEDCKLVNTSKFVIGVSGGADSTCLLHLFSLSHPIENLLAVYVNHNLRPYEVPYEIDTITALCHKLKIECKIDSVNVKDFAQAEKMSTEEAARALRYRSFEKARVEFKAEKICVGHNQNDQVEEFFIRLIRGSNLAGLSGMNMVNKNIIRPLLSEKKQTLINHLKQHKIDYCHDSSNDDPEFLRNRVRHQLLPVLVEQYNASMANTVLQTMSIFREENDYLENSVQMVTEKSVKFSSCSAELIIEPFKKNHKALKRRTIEHILWQLDCKPSFNTIEAVVELAESGERGKELHLKKGLRIKNDQKTLLFFYPHGLKAHRRASHQRREIHLTVTEPGSYTLEQLNKRVDFSILKEKPGKLQKGQLLIDMNGFSFPLQIRTRRDGEYFTPFGTTGTKKVNRFLTDRKVNKEQKDEYPLLLTKENIIGILGIEIDNTFRTTRDTKEFLLISLQDIE